MTCRKFFLFFFLSIFSLLLFSSSKSFSQDKNDSIAESNPADSLSLLHSPKKATIMSAVLPGLGQAYNKKYWKIPVIYAGFAGMAYLISFNNTRYSTYKSAYGKRLDGDSTTTDDYVGKYTDEQLGVLKDYYRRNRDLSIIVAGLIYVLNIVDASVDAHLFYFNVNDDLSLKIDPSVQFDQNFQPIAGLGLHFSF